MKLPKKVRGLPNRRFNLTMRTWGKLGPQARQAPCRSRGTWWAAMVVNRVKGGDNRES